MSPRFANLVLPKGGAKHELLFKILVYVVHPSPTWTTQQSVTKIISLTVVNLVTPKAGAKGELLFNKLVYCVHPSPTWTTQQSVTKIISLTVVNLVTPKAGAKESYLKHLRIWLRLKVELSMSFCLTNWSMLYIHVQQQSVTKIISPRFANLVMPKVGAKHDHLFNKLVYDVPRWVFWISKSNLSSTTKCDQNHISDICEFGYT
jgi:hypothetical protein